MDVGGDCGTVGVVVIMVTAVARVAALIRINLFNCVFGGGICGICSIFDGICCVASGSCSYGNSDYGGPSFCNHHYYHYKKHTHGDIGDGCRKGSRFD